MESNFVNDLIESEALFKAQFNPDSILFHNGDPTPVPVGGQRIPTSMPTVFNPDVKESDEKPQNYGPEYDNIFTIRDFFNGLKKVLAKLTPPIEAILRHKDTFTKKGNPNNQDHVNKLKSSIDTEKEKISLVLKELKTHGDVLKSFPEYKETFYPNLNKLIENGLVDYQDKEQFTTYSFEVKNYSKDVFKEMGILLEKMKSIKKEAEHKNNNNIGKNSKPIIEKTQEESKKE